MSLIINVVILFVVFGLLQKRLKPIQIGIVFGAIKAALYLIFTGSVIDALVFGAIFGLLAFGMKLLFVRLQNKPNPIEDPSKAYKAMGASKGVFYWEYIPLVAILLVMAFGELALSFVTITIR
jgi:hypothetical protein